MDCQYGGIRERLDEMLATAEAERLAQEVQRNRRAEAPGKAGPLGRLRLALFGGRKPKARIDPHALRGSHCEPAASHR